MRVTFVLCQFSFSNFRSYRDETIFDSYIAYSLMRILRTYHQLVSIETFMILRYLNMTKPTKHKIVGM